MCGRYIPNTEVEVQEIRLILNRIAIRLSEQGNDTLQKNGDALPGDVNPILYQRNGQNIVSGSLWGFPKWDGKGSIINARSENVSKSRFFSPCLKNRCVIPAHGYYEWQTTAPKRKQKYRFYDPESRHGMFLAGLFSVDGRCLRYVILTDEATEELRQIHDRMPLLVPETVIKPWLDGKLSVPELAKLEKNRILFEKAI